MDKKEKNIVSTQAIDRHIIIERFTSGEVNRRVTSEVLNLSERQVTRLGNKYKSDSIFGLNHGNFGKKSPNATNEIVISKILSLYAEKYNGFNCKHFSEYLYRDEKIEIGYSTLKRIISNLRGTRSKQRRSRHRKYRQRYHKTGLFFQMDGSDHEWVKGKRWCLIAGIDDATSFVPYGEFFEFESLNGYLEVLKKVFTQWGLPLIIYVDHAAWLSGTTKDPERGEFRRICKTLGIQLIFADSPQAKGRVERLWRTFQDRLCAEFKLWNIETMDAANRYLNEKFLINTWNKFFTVMPRSNESGLRVSPKIETLTEIFAIRKYRSIRNDFTFLYEKKMYQIHTDIGHNARKNEIEIREFKNSVFGAYFMGKKLEITLIDRVGDPSMGNRTRDTSPHGNTEKNTSHLPEKAQKTLRAPSTLLEGGRDTLRSVPPPKSPGMLTVSVGRPRKTASGKEVVMHNTKPFGKSKPLDKQDSRISDYPYDKTESNLGVRR